MGTIVTWLSSFVYSGVDSTFRAVMPPFLRELLGWFNPGYGPWVGWMASFCLGLYACLFMLHRASRYRTYRYLSVNTGHFYSGGRMYYRGDADGPLYRVELKKAKGVDLAGSLLAPEYEYFTTDLPQGLVILFDGETVAGVGWRYENTLVTARHLADNASELWVQGTKSRVRVNTIFAAPPREKYEHTGADIASANLPQSTWSQIGSKALSKKTGQVLEAADGRPFYRHIGKAKGSNRKKARTEPLRLSDEEKDFLRSIGVEGNYVLPPTDEKSIQRSMAVQAKKQTTRRGLPMMEFMTDAWTQK